MTLRTPILRILALVPLSFLIAGCALTSTHSIPPALGLSLKGSVHGGQQPINGAHIYLLAASSSGYGTASVSLLNSVSTGSSDSIGAYVSSAADGSWSISGDYTCTPNSQVYLYALGGDPGAGVNSASGLLAVLGNCPGSGNFASSVPYIAINEVTTVAAAYAMSGYAVDALHVASSGSPRALTGIANAFANAANLADLPSGTALSVTPYGNGAVPQAQINLLANIVASCVNSVGPGSATCTTLLGDATSDGTSGGASPSETATAMINIAHNPGANIADLFNLPPAQSPFAPTPSTQPHDLTVSLEFTGAGMHSPTSVAIDGAGNAWITNGGANTVTVLSSLGVPLSGSPLSGNGLSAPVHVAIDNVGHAWIANSNNTSLSEFDAAGNAMSGSPFSTGSSNRPHALAIDSNNSVWVAAPANNDVTLLSSAGTSFITGDSLASPFGVAIDASGNAWIINQASNSVTILDHTGSPLTNSPVSGVGINNAYAISIDGSGNAWIANIGSNSVSVLDHTGTPISGSPFSVGGLVFPICTAFDGAGNAWIANGVGFGITELTGSGMAVTGSPFIAASISNPYFIAVDGSGSVWVANEGGDSLTEFIGSATPTVTPMATALANGSVGARP